MRGTVLALELHVACDATHTHTRARASIMASQSLGIVFPRRRNGMVQRRPQSHDGPGSDLFDSIAEWQATNREGKSYVSRDMRAPICSPFLNKCGK